MHTQHNPPRYRVEVWVAAHDARGPYATLRAVTFRTVEAATMFCGAVSILADLAGDPRQLPRIADIVCLH